MFSIDSFESEDKLIISVCTSDGSVLDPEQSAKLFSLPAEVVQNYTAPSANILKAIQDNIEQQKSTILDDSQIRNSGYFDQEMEKLEKWAEDRKNSLEIKLKELDIEIKSQKTESRKLMKLDEKVAMQREIKELEKKRSTLRQNLFESQDEVDKRKDDLLNEIEQRLRQELSMTDLFSVMWKIV